MEAARPEHLKTESWPPLSQILVDNPSYSNDDPDLQEFLSHPDLNFRVMEEIYNEHARKSDVASIPPLIPKERILFEIDEADASNSATLDNTYGVIVFSRTWWNKKKRTAPDAKAIRGFSVAKHFKEIDLEKRYDLIRLCSFFHEQWHQLAGESELNSTSWRHRVQTGLEKNTQYALLPEPKQSGFRINEGLTELLARETLVEYVRHIGGYRDSSPREAAIFITLLNQLPIGSGGYQGEVITINMLIQVIANILSVSYTHIKQACIKEYLTFGTIFSDQLEQEFRDAQQSEMYSKIKKMLDEEPFWTDKDASWKKRYPKVKDFLWSLLSPEQQTALEATYPKLHQFED